MLVVKLSRASTTGSMSFSRLSNFVAVARQFLRRQFAGFGAGEDLLGVAAFWQHPPHDARTARFQIEHLAVFQSLQSFLEKPSELKRAGHQQWPAGEANPMERRHHGVRTKRRA